jgi:hypothetical protein
MGLGPIGRGPHLHGASPLIHCRRLVSLPRYMGFDKTQQAKIQEVKYLNHTKLDALAFLAQACCSSPVLTFMLRASRWTTREPNRRLQITVLPVVRRRMAGCVSSYAHKALSNQPAGDDFR